MKRENRVAEIFQDEELLRKIIDFIPCPFGISQGEPVDEDILYLNRAFREELGYGYSELPTAREWFNTLYPDPEYRQKVLKDWYDKVEKVRQGGGESVTAIAKLRLKNGEDKWFEINASLLDKYFVVAFKDIDEVYKKKEELQRRNDFKDRILSVLTHDLRAPLAQLGALAELMSVADFSPEQMDGFCKKITNEVKSVSDFINNTAHWASANFGYLNIRKESFDAGELFDEMIKYYGAVAETKNVNLSLNVKPPSVLSTDKEVLRIILRNLISNAVKFTPPGKNVKVTGNSDGSAFRFLVEDEGMGIDPEHLKELKEGRLSSRLGTTREKGLGIGLSICFDMAKRLDARLDFESEPAKGTRAILLV